MLQLDADGEEIVQAGHEHELAQIAVHVAREDAELVELLPNRPPKMVGLRVVRVGLLRGWLLRNAESEPMRLQ